MSAEALPGAPCSDALFFALIPDATAASRMAEIGREQRLKHGLTGKLLAPDSCICG